MGTGELISSPSTASPSRDSIGVVTGEEMDRLLLLLLLLLLLRVARAGVRGVGVELRRLALLGGEGVRRAGVGVLLCGVPPRGDLGSSG